MNKLTSLVLSDNGIGDGGAQAIAGSENMNKLTSLVLRDNGIGDVTKDQLRNSPNLQKARDAGRLLL
jgi:Leucine-rich repeat (LRR) protein